MQFSNNLDSIKFNLHGSINHNLKRNEDSITIDVIIKKHGSIKKEKFQN